MRSGATMVATSASPRSSISRWVDASVTIWKMMRLKCEPFHPPPYPGNWVSVTCCCPLSQRSSM